MSYLSKYLDLARALSKVWAERSAWEWVVALSDMMTGATESYQDGDDYSIMDEMTIEGWYVRFAPRANNTVVDTATGLEWIADVGTLGGVWGTPGNPNKMTWNEAIEACNNLNYAGHSDWRLPNINELEKLIDYGEKLPAADKAAFPDTQNDFYWSSSMTNHGCENEFDPSFGDGHRSWDPDKEDEKYVRPVRGTESTLWQWIRMILNGLR